MINAVGAENVGKSMVNTGEWIQKEVGGRVLEGAQIVGNGILEVTSHPPFANSPDIQGMQIQIAQEGRSGTLIDQGVKPTKNLETSIVTGAKRKEVESGHSDWVTTSAHTEPATKKGARDQGASIQELKTNKNSGEALVKHTVVNKNGKVVHSDVRTTYKPRAGDTNDQSSGK